MLIMRCVISILARCHVNKPHTKQSRYNNEAEQSELRLMKETKADERNKGRSMAKQRREASHSSANVSLWARIEKKIQKKKPSNQPLFHKRGSERSERASKRVSAAERASKASSGEQANKWAVWVIKPSTPICILGYSDPQCVSLVVGKFCLSPYMASF